VSTPVSTGQHLLLTPITHGQIRQQHLQEGHTVRERKQQQGSGQGAEGESGSGEGSGGKG